MSRSTQFDQFLEDDGKTSHYLKPFLHPQRVLFLDGEGVDKSQVIEELVGLSHNQGCLQDKDVFLGAVLERECIVSTGLGAQMAIPHAKTPEEKHFFITIAVLKKGVEWKSIDNLPVKLVFLIGGPEGQQTQYLKILSSLTEAIREKDRRDMFFSTNDGEEVISLMTNEKKRSPC